MKPKTLGILALCCMGVVGGTVFAVTPEGGAASAGGSQASVAEPVDTALLVAGQVGVPSKATFSGGTALRVDGRVGHARLGAAGGRETFVLLTLRGDDEARGGAPSGVDLSIVVDKSGSMRGRRLENAISAAVGAVERLRDGDRVSVIAFDTGTETVVPTSVVGQGSRRRITDAIRGIRLGGDTCISCGMEAGLSALREGTRLGDAATSVRQMLLLSDGQPTSGVRDTAGFRTIAERALAENVSVTTIGVDLSFNEELMSAIAVASNGGHYFVERETDLPRVFAAEADKLAASVASGAVAEIDLAPGVELVQLFDRPFTRSGSRLSVPLGSFSKGEAKTVLVKVRAPSSREGGAQELASVRVAFRDLGRGADQSVSGALAVELVGEGTETGEIDPLVLDRLQRSETAAALRDANSLFTLGKNAEAQRRLGDARSSLRAARKATEATPRPGGDVDKSFADQDDQLREAEQGFAAPPPVTPASPARPAPPADEVFRQQEGLKKKNAARSRAQML